VHSCFQSRLQSRQLLEAEAPQPCRAAKRRPPPPPATLFRSKLLQADASSAGIITSLSARLFQGGSWALGAAPQQHEHNPLSNALPAPQGKSTIPPLSCVTACLPAMTPGCFHNSPACPWPALPPPQACTRGASSPGCCCKPRPACSGRSMGMAACCASTLLACEWGYIICAGKRARPHEIWLIASASTFKAGAHVRALTRITVHTHNHTHTCNYTHTQTHTQHTQTHTQHTQTHTHTRTHTHTHTGC